MNTIIEHYKIVLLIIGLFSFIYLSSYYVQNGGSPYADYLYKYGSANQDGIKVIDPLSDDIRVMTQKETRSHVPSWATDAIWYQIFVERFRSGSADNNPTRESLSGAWPDEIPTSWAVTPWTQDWYKPDPWFKDCREDHFYHGIQARRYGGDLVGVKEKLDYLEDLGINAIYFNPLNDAPSLHKYDAAHYRHIDRYFGPDPIGDSIIISQEIPDDPSTWKWTSADLLFLDIIRDCHKRGIKVVMDYSWNHSGRNCWAFKDVQEKGEKSKFKDWYYINKFDDENTIENEFEYKSWFGATTLPEFKEKIITPILDHNKLQLLEGDLYSESLKSHINNVSRRWLDPDNDGDPSDGIDGFRLDVAVEIPMGFWRSYRQQVKAINPEAILIGEVWWEQWPDKLFDPIPFMDDAFDAVMNYRWYRAARSLIAPVEDHILPSTFVSNIESQYLGMDKNNQYAMMNLVSSHDTPRVLSSLYNQNPYKQNAKPQENKQYRIHKPDQNTYDLFKLLLIHQFTFVGAPHIWNGDEMGMWGADDPDCRKPLIWPDLIFDREVAHPVDTSNLRSDEVKFNEEIFGLYKSLTQLRTDNKVLRRGDLNFFLADDNRMIVGYERTLDDSQAMIVINLSLDRQDVKLDDMLYTNYHNPLTNQIFRPDNDEVVLDMLPRSAQVLLNKK